MIAAFMDAVAEHAAVLVGLSALTLVIGVVLAPAMILRMPADYFLPEHRIALAERAGHPAARLALAAAKNLLGAVLLLAGVAMLFLPGQGLLTLLAGLIIMNYPGKYRFERWLVRRPHVLTALNWLRTRYGRRPLLAP